MRDRFPGVWVCAWVAACGGEHAGGAGETGSSTSAAESSSSTGTESTVESTGSIDDTSSEDVSTSVATTMVASSEGDTSPSSCGDGVVDGDEQCDDGNAMDGDGCNADCTTDRAALWEVTWDGPGDEDFAYDVVVDSGNRVHFLAAIQDGGPIESLLGVLAPDGGEPSFSALEPQIALHVEIRDDVLVLAGQDRDVGAPWIRTQDTEGAPIWELVDDSTSGGHARRVTWLDDGSIAYAGVNAGSEQLVGRVSADGELLSSTVVFDGYIYDVTAVGDRVFASGGTSPDGFFWLAGIEMSGEIAWSVTELAAGGGSVAATADGDILTYHAGVVRYSTAGQLLEENPIEQTWWRDPRVAIDPSGDVLLVGLMWNEIDPHGVCQVARLNPDLTEKWERTIETARDCYEIHTAPDGTLVIVGESAANSGDGTVAFIARIAP